MKAPKRLDISEAELEGLVAKAASVLSADEHAKLKAALETLLYLTSELDKKRVSIQRLKAMLFGASSEKTSGPRLRDLLKQIDSSQTSDDAATTTPSGPEQRAETSSSSREKAAGHGRHKASDYQGGTHTHVRHPELKAKDPCPTCHQGKLYPQKQPKVIVRLRGSAPIQADVWSAERLRCGLCGALFTAPLPEEAGPAEKYDASVTSTIALMRYGYGMPFHRLASIQQNVGIPLPSSSQWDLIERSVDTVAPVFTELIREAARGELIHNDDTTARVLELMKKHEPSAGDGVEKEKKRRGIFTTGLLSKLGERMTALYVTGHAHAGDNLAKVLEACEPDRGPLIQMSDGLPCNAATFLPKGLAVIEANCLTHGRRKYVEIADNFPEQCLHVLGEIEKVYKNDAYTKTMKMNAAERLVYHQAHSRSVMDDLEAWLKKQLSDKLVEPNSAFGEATRYMLKRWDKLTRFLTVAGAPLDNNTVERALKRSIRHRKNSLFYKTLHGARVGDMYMSLIHTCELNGLNPFDYLTRLLRHGPPAKGTVASWMPWSDTVASSENTAA